LLHFEASEGVECAEGLVHEENGRIGGEGSGQAGTLALATRELAWIATGEGGWVEAYGGEKLVGAAEALGSGEVLGFEDEGDVALEGEVGEEAHFLDDVADRSAKGDQVAISSVNA
jgi:hypothetical protein